MSATLCVRNLSVRNLCWDVSFGTTVIRHLASSSDDPTPRLVPEAPRSQPVVSSFAARPGGSQRYGASEPGQPFGDEQTRYYTASSGLSGSSGDEESDFSAKRQRDKNPKICIRRHGDEEAAVTVGRDGGSETVL